MPKDRRASLHESRGEKEKLSQTPIEIPLGTRREAQSLSDQIQQQIAIQLAKKQQGVDQQTPDQIYAELLDLDDPGPEHMYSQYEYENMEDTLMEGIDIPIEGGASPESAPLEEEMSTPPQTSSEAV